MEKTEREVAVAVLEKAKAMLKEHLQKAENMAPKAPAMEPPKAPEAKMGQTAVAPKPEIPAQMQDSYKLKKIEKLQGFIAKKEQKRQLAKTSTPAATCPMNKECK
jgi:type II secretory pathway component PulL